MRLQADILCHMVLSTEQDLGALNGLFNETVRAYNSGLMEFPTDVFLVLFPPHPVDAVTAK